MVVCFSRIGPLGELVRVEVDLRNGLPGTDLVGLPGSEVREARERVRAAIRNSGYTYPRQRILINLAPAAIVKRGAGFDLAIAVALLSATEQIRLTSDILVMGELALTGEVKPVPAILSAIAAAREEGVGDALVAEESGDEALSVAKRVYSTSHLRNLQAALNQPVSRTNTLTNREPVAAYGGGTFDDIIGQRVLKRSALIAAAGAHNLLLMGPPGSGKTMTATRVASILPDLSQEKALESARIFSIRGIHRVEGPLSRRPPSRMPHHSATAEGMLGGGRNYAPGEISLAHNGTLILDEAHEFRPNLLQALREPIETGYLRLVRVGAYLKYPARFQLIMTTNLCPCGKLGVPGETCMCSLQEISRYWKRLGNALLDRMDIRVRTEYTGARRDAGEDISHAEMVKLVQNARDRQRIRFSGNNCGVNSRVPESEMHFLAMPPKLENRLEKIITTQGLSDRALHAVRSIARTVADVNDHETVEEADLMEAVSFRAVKAESVLGMGSKTPVY